MRALVPRLLLAGSALIFTFGGVMHAAVFWAKAASGIDRSDLPPFFASEVKVLWLSDSTTLIGIAVVLAFLAIRPASADKSAIMLLALVPAATAALLYLFLGAFYAAHLLLAGSTMILAAGLLTHAERTPSQ